MSKPSRVVNSRNSITEWRGDGVVSDGGSRELIRRLLESQHSSRLQDDEENAEAQPSYITAFIEDLEWAFRELNCKVDERQVERLAILIHESLTKEYRGYHGVEHVFAISAGGSPLQVLAAFFRDITSHYIDLECSPWQEDLIEGIFKKGTCKLNALESERDQIVAFIFGHSPGEDLQTYRGLHKGFDIFLSAVTASRLLKDILSLKQTAKLCTCLEASIPFRKFETDGPTPLDRLHERLIQCNQNLKLEMTDQEMIETVQQGADLANRNVGNMLSDELEIFLDHTWSLLPEQHAALRRRTLYTLYDYHAAIYSMAELMQQMEPANVYVSFLGVPDQSELDRFHDRLGINLPLATTYIHARLLSIALVSAFACLTGGDAPKSFFFGDVPSFQRADTHRLGDSLLVTSESNERRYNTEVYDLLRGDRMAETGFDTRNAPLAAYLYRQLGDEILQQTLDGCVAPITEESSWALLRCLPEAEVTAVGKEVGRFAVSRLGAIEQTLGLAWRH